MDDAIPVPLKREPRRVLGLRIDAPQEPTVRHRIGHEEFIRFRHSFVEGPHWEQHYNTYGRRYNEPMEELFSGDGWKIVREEAKLPDGRIAKRTRASYADTVHLLAVDKD